MKLKTKNRRHSIDTISISHYFSLQTFWKIFPNFSSQVLPLISSRLHKNTQLIAPVVSFSSLISLNSVYSDLKYINFTLKAHYFPGSRTIHSSFFLKFPLLHQSFHNFQFFLQKIHSNWKALRWFTLNVARCVARCVTWRDDDGFCFCSFSGVMFARSLRLSYGIKIPIDATRVALTVFWKSRSFGWHSVPSFSRVFLNLNSKLSSFSNTDKNGSRLVFGSLAC